MRHSIPLLALFLAAALSPFLARSQPIHQGTLAGKQNSGPLSVSLSKDQTVSYLIELSSSYYYGASVAVEGFNHKGTSLFTRSAYTGMAGNVITVTLPAGTGHLVPYRGTAHQIGRPAYLVVTSLNEPVTYSVHESKNDRQDYNEGGLSMGEAKTIAPYETVKGNVHWIEGNDVQPGDRPSPGGQWFKVTLEPRQAIRPHGWALGHPTNGASFFVSLYDESGAHLKTIANVAAYGLVAFPNAQGVGSFVYQNAATEPKTFYVQVYSKLFITHDFEFSPVEVMMEISLGPETINPNNGYSEDSTIYVRAVRGDTFETLSNFVGTVAIVDLASDSVYSYNGGFLPSSVAIGAGSGGVATFVAQSKIGPRQFAPVGLRWPRPAWLAASNFRQIPSAYLEVAQWTTAGSKIDNRADDGTPNWMQKRILDLFENTGLTEDDRAILNSVKSYSILDLGSYIAGRTAFEKQTELPILLNPFVGREMRLNSAGSSSICSTGIPSRSLTTALFHEARHAYQANQSTTTGNDSDDDYLVIYPYSHFPTYTVIDSTDSRDVCIIYPESGYSELERRSYRGPMQKDEWMDPDHALRALDYDAYIFGSLPRTY